MKGATRRAGQIRFQNLDDPSHAAQGRLRLHKWAEANRHAEDGAAATEMQAGIAVAAVNCGSEESTIGVLDQCPIRLDTIRTIGLRTKALKSCQCATRRDPKNRTPIIGSAISGCPVQVPVQGLYQPPTGPQPSGQPF